MFFAVYDGHNGEAAVEFVQKYLPLNICRQPHFLTNGISAAAAAAVAAAAVAAAVGVAAVAVGVAAVAAAATTATAA